MTTFSQIGISEPFIKALKENNILEPTEIQKRTIPYLINDGKDLIAQAQTGTGKTAAFGLPVLEKTDPSQSYIQTLILCPTRELGQQIGKQLFRFTKHCKEKIFVETVYGGAPIGDQIKRLARPTHILVATPGRLIDLLERKAVDIKKVHTIVLDEADEMLSMGFKKELDTILSQTAGQRYTWLFSATMPDDIKAIISKYMAANAYRVQVDKDNIVNKNIEHRYIECEEKEKFDVLLQFLKRKGDQRGVIFCKTKSSAHTLAKQLTAKNIPADAIQGDLQQKERDKVMRAFKNQKLQLLVATDLAARGIDVENLSFVVHYNLPDQLEYYTHRSGRTARAGNKGLSVCIVTNRDFRQLKNIENALAISIKPMEV